MGHHTSPNLSTQYKYMYIFTYINNQVYPITQHTNRETYNYLISRCLGDELVQSIAPCFIMLMIYTLQLEIWMVGMDNAILAHKHQVLCQQIYFDITIFVMAKVMYIYILNQSLKNHQTIYYTILSPICLLCKFATKILLETSAQKVYLYWMIISTGKGLEKEFQTADLNYYT